MQLPLHIRRPTSGICPADRKMEVTHEPIYADAAGEGTTPHNWTAPGNAAGLRPTTQPDGNGGGL